MTAARAAAGRFPRHLVLGALCVGLALGGRSPSVLPALAAAGAAAFAPRRALAVAAGVAVLIGALVTQWRTQHVGRSALASSPGALLTADATVIAPPRSSPYGTSVVARVRGETVLVRVRDARAGEAGVGDVVRAIGRARLAGAYARSRGAVAELTASRWRPTGRHRRSVVDAVRRSAQDALAHRLPPAEAALLRGMVLGDDSRLPDEVREDFRATGLTHLTAASGANVALLAALVVGAGRLAGIGLTARWAAVLALIALYVPLAGGGPSIQRAGIMGAAGAAAVIAGRPASRGYALLLAVAGTLALDPGAPSDPGWQLSFAAVGLLLLRGRAWSERLQRRGLAPPLADAVAVTTAATLATAPIVAAHFDRVPLAALPVNIVAAPLVAPIMWLGALAVVSGPLLPAAAGLLDAVAGFPLACLVALAHAGARLPGAQLTAPPAAVAAVCLLLVGWIERHAILALAGGRHRARLTAAAALAALAGAGWAGAATASRDRAPGAPPPGRLRLTFLDVGQGDAVLAQDGDRAILVDTGPPEGRVVDRLRRAGVRRLDLLVITHAETDHAGGAAGVLRALPVAAVLDGRDGVVRPVAVAAGAAIAARRVRRIVPTAGQVVRIGRLTLRVLWPPAEPAARHAGANPNDRAVVAELDAAGARVLLPADAESPVTLPLHPTGPFDVLKVAHHGSEDPGLPALLAAVRPHVAVISVGSHNTFGHPTAQALAALRGVPTLLRTDRDGSIRLDRTDGGWEIRTHV